MLFFPWLNRRRSPILGGVMMFALMSLGPVGAIAGETSPPLDLLEAGFALMDQEAIGDLRLHLPATDLPPWVEKDCTIQRDRTTYWGATGDYHQVWTSGDCGWQLVMRSAQPHSPQRIDRLEIFAPSSLKTARGVGIGSRRAEVFAAYGAYHNTEAAIAPDVFIAGTPYGGLIFFFYGDRVYRLFLGAAAE